MLKTSQITNVVAGHFGNGGWWGGVIMRGVLVTKGGVTMRGVPVTKGGCYHAWCTGNYEG